MIGGKGNWKEFREVFLLTTVKRPELFYLFFKKENDELVILFLEGFFSLYDTNPAR